MWDINEEDAFLAACVCSFLPLFLPFPDFSPPPPSSLPFLLPLSFSLSFSSPLCLSLSLRASSSVPHGVCVRGIALSALTVSASLGLYDW